MQVIHKSALIKRMLIGASVAFILICLFVLPVKTDPEWHPLWKLRPLLIVPFAGATGGAFFYFIQRNLNTGTKKFLGYFLSLIVYLIGLWMGAVLGLDGTLWN